jgi:hypothetical protein
MRILAVAAVALALAAPAAAATPRFALLDLHDLVRASKNEFGDVKPSARRPHAPLVARCAQGCRLGRGWLGFHAQIGPAASDILSAAAGRGRIGWSVRLTLSRRGQARWRSFARAAARRAKREGVPDVIAVAVAGRIVGIPFANQVSFRGRRLDLPGFSRADARAAAKSLRR